MTDEERLLRECKTIAVVGLSSDPAKPSFNVAKRMQSWGFRIVPVNPKETEVLGEKAYPAVQDIPEPIDLVNVFRRPAAVPEVVRQAVAKGGVKGIWMQIGIENEEAAALARENGLLVVEDTCIMIEYGRLERKG